MLTFFTTAKPFEGHSGIIQRNALKSWKMLHPDVEVILFGDEPGAAEVCREMGLRHEPHVERHESSMKYLNYMFARAQEIASHSYLCYSNCDIVLMKDYFEAFKKAVAWRQAQLFIGQRWDTDVTQPLDFSSGSWERELRQFTATKGVRQNYQLIDYFAFNKGLYDKVPPLVVGRSYWDWWLIWKALSARVPVVDGSAAFTAVHQNHGHAYHPDGKHGTNVDSLALRNRSLAGDGRELANLVDVTHKLTRDGEIRRVRLRRVRNHPVVWKTYQFGADSTFKLRKLLGLRRESLRKLFSRGRHSDAAGHEGVS